MQALQNLGRINDFISGISGVSAGGQALVNLPVNRRYHSLKLQCEAVNYTGGTGAAITKITGSGTGATGTLTISNGVPTAITIVAGGSGWTVGDTFTIADATGEGFVGTVATVTGGPPGALATATVTTAGTPSPISPASFFQSVKVLVNGIVMRDISPLEILKICTCNEKLPLRGELPIYFTEPWRNTDIDPNTLTSWDLTGQNTFQLQLGIKTTVTNPTLVGIEEYDFQRNTRPGKDGAPVPFLQPVAQHSFSFNLGSGRNDINTLPIDFPILRMWLQGATASNIYQVELLQDSNMVFQGTLEQLVQTYRDYEFSFGEADYINQNWASNNTIKGQFAEPLYFDAAFISDYDDRPWEALKCQNSMILRLYLTAADTVTVTMETLPGAFA